MSRCGDCVKWLKRPDCPHENGMGSERGGPSAGQFACSVFLSKNPVETPVTTPSSTDWAREMAKDFVERALLAYQCPDIAISEYVDQVARELLSISKKAREEAIEECANLLIEDDTSTDEIFRMIRALADKETK